MDDKDLLPPRPNPGAQFTLAGLAANQAAAANRFADYRLRRAAHTLRRQDADLALFGQYLQEVSAISPHPALSQGERGMLPSPLGGRVGDEGESPIPGQQRERKSLPPALLIRCRELRKNATDAENLLWRLLRNRRLIGEKFRRQHPHKGYILDFYCHAAHLAVELDGSGHLEEIQAKHDARRTAVLAEDGIRVLRFWNHQVLRQTEAVLEEIYFALATPSPNPLLKGEGNAPHPALSQGERESLLSPASWSGVTWGLVDGFTRWLLLHGYSVSSVNVRLSTVKTYCKLATQAGAIPAAEYALIRLVQGYSRKEARRVDQRRAAADMPQRVGLKKARPVPLTPQQAAQLKQQPDTPQGRRDTLLLCLLLDHGLRAGEVTLLLVEDFDLQAGVFRFHRPKVDKTQTHRLSPETQAAARAYLQQDALPSGKLLRASRKDGSLRQAGLSERAVSARVEFLGMELGITGLSAHDCRHYWATRAARAGTPLERLQDAGGWASLAMPSRYIEAADIANEGVELE